MIKKGLSTLFLLEILLIIYFLLLQDDDEICQARLKFPASLSRGVKNLIQGCLQPDERNRMRMGDVVRDPWVRGEGRYDSESGGSL